MNFSRNPGRLVYDLSALAVPGRERDGKKALIIYVLFDSIRELRIVRSVSLHLSNRASWEHASRRCGGGAMPFILTRYFYISSGALRNRLN